MEEGEEEGREEGWRRVDEEGRREDGNEEEERKISSCWACSTECLAYINAFSWLLKIKLNNKELVFRIEME